MLRKTLLAATLIATPVVSAAIPFPTPTPTVLTPTWTATQLVATPTASASVPTLTATIASPTPTVTPSAVPDLIVNTLADHDDGSCTVVDCTLREAINAANSQAGPQTIGFSVTGTILLAVALGPLSTIAEAVTIDGPGADNLTVDANGTGSVLIVNTGVTADISGLTLMGGQSAVDGGGGILNRGILTLSQMMISGNTAIYGGGIYNPSGTLAISSSTIRGNDTFYYGSGIWNDGGVLTLTDATVSNNNAGGYRTGGIVSTGGHATLTNSTVNGNISTNQGAGGILNWAASLTLINSTVSGNIGSGYGGGISNVYSGAVTLTNSTVSGNGDTSVPGGGILNDSGTTTLRSTIVANNSPADCFGAIATLGHNLASDASCAFGGAGDMNSTNPLLDPLANNGGPTETHALQPGSPAIDAGDNSGCPIDDQRGVARPYNGICDIGAYEYTVAPPTPTVTPSAATTDTQSQTPTPSATPTATESATATPSATPTTTESATPTTTESASPTASETPTLVPTATATPTATPTLTAVPTATATTTDTASATATSSPTEKATATSTSTPLATSTATSVQVFTATATSTRTATPTRTPPPAACDLAITKTINPSLAPVGSQVTVTLSVTNLGFGVCPPPITVQDLPQAFGVVLIAPVVVNPPLGFQCIIGGTSPFGFHCTNQGPPLFSHQTVTFTVNGQVLAPPGTSIQNCGTVTNQSDTYPPNNQACTTMNVFLPTPTRTRTVTPTPTITSTSTPSATSTATSVQVFTATATSTRTATPTRTPPPAACDLAITKTINPSLAPVGSQVTVTLSVTNLGFGVCPPPITVQDLPQAFGVVLIAPVVVNPPLGFQCIIGGTSPFGFHCTNQGPPLFSHQTVTFTVNGQVLAPPGTSIQNCGTVTNQSDTYPPNNQACTTMNVFLPTPTRTRTVTPTPTITSTSTPSATSTATSVQVFTATATSTRTATPTRTPPPAACDLAITKTINPSLAPVGSQVTVTLSVTNLGFGVCPPPITVQDLPQAFGVVLIAPVVVNPPLGFQCIIGGTSPFGFHCTNQGPPLFSHQTVTFTVNGQVLAPPGTSIQNCGTVTDQSDTNPANNQACTTVNVGPPAPTRTATPTRTVTNTSTATPTATPTNTPVNPCPGTPADGTTCDAGTDSPQTMIFIGGTCVPCAAATSAAPRFVDNCNGTITDRQTCLVWEKKDDAGGLHDKDNTYQWCLDADNNGQCDSPGFPPDGGAFSVFIAGLNSAGFAGHHDWRLPNEDGRNGSGPNELESILALPFQCSVGPPCVDTAFNTNCGVNSDGNGGCTVDGAASTQECSCTQAVLDDEYWSATTAYFPTIAWEVVFSSGHAGPNVKTTSLYVRAVRGGL